MKYRRWAMVALTVWMLLTVLGAAVLAAVLLFVEGRPLIALGFALVGVFDLFVARWLWRWRPSDEAT